MKTKFSGNDFLSLGYPQNIVIGFALNIANEKFSHQSKKDTLALFKKLIEYPENFLDDTVLAPVAKAITEASKISKKENTPLSENKRECKIYGAQHIEPGAIQQMEVAMQLPVTVAGS